MTPGQLAYEAWWLTFGDGQQNLRDGEPWGRLTPRQQHAWEAAAQAVLVWMGSISAVPGPVSLTCQPQPGGRR